MLVNGTRVISYESSKLSGLKFIKLLYTVHISISECYFIFTAIVLALMCELYAIVVRTISVILVLTQRGYIVKWII